MQNSTGFHLLKQNVPTISVGILSADLMHFESEVALLEGLNVKMLHFDVMDGCFVPYLTVGPRFIKAVKTNLLKDIHLMVREPEKSIEQYVDAGGDIITIQLESTKDTRPILRKLGEMKNANDPNRGIIRGVALNPGTPVKLLETLLDDIEVITVLAVDLKVNGFPFFDSIGDKFEEVRNMVSRTEKKVLLCIDGGVKRNNIGELAKFGADILVSGSAVFSGDGAKENIKFMLNAVNTRST